MNINDLEAERELDRRKREWLYEDDRNRERVAPFTDDEVRVLRNLHIAVRAMAEAYMPDGRAYCIECGQPWTDGGCPTVRLLANWHWQHRRIRQLGKRVDNMAEFLAEYFGWREVSALPGRRVAECRLTVDHGMLEQGRMLAVDHLLHKMREQWRYYLEQLFPPTQMEVAAKAFNESLANIERDKRRQADGG